MEDHTGKLRLEKKKVEGLASVAAPILNEIGEDEIERHMGAWLLAELKPLAEDLAKIDLSAFSWHWQVVGGVALNIWNAVLDSSPPLNVSRTLLDSTWSLGQASSEEFARMSAAEIQLQGLILSAESITGVDLDPEYVLGRIVEEGGDQAQAAKGALAAWKRIQECPADESRIDALWKAMENDPDPDGGSILVGQLKSS